MVSYVVQQIEKEVLFPVKVLIKAAPRNSGSLNDLINGYVGITDVGKLLPSGLHQAHPFFLRQAEKSSRRHVLNSYMTSCHIL